MEIDALINSVNDPQLPRCLEAVSNQTVPFSKIIHNHNVCPHHVSFNNGIKKTTGDWVMEIGGDAILDLDAVERVKIYVEENEVGRIAGYFFGLRDTFLDLDLGYIGIHNGPLYRDREFPNVINCDGVVLNQLKREGWKVKKDVHFIIGTHFDQPDEYQVFKRCYVNPVRHPNNDSLKNILEKLYRRTRNPLYSLGLEAMEYGRKKNFYPGSHNLEFDRANYEEWRNNREDKRES